MVKFLDLVAQYHSIKEEIDTAISDVLNQGSYIGGPSLTKFEDEFAHFVGAEFCIGVGNGTDALEIAIESLCLPLGSEVIIPGNSFIASSEAVTRSGLKVVFADVSSENYTICIESIRSKISERTSAIMAVHIYGHPCNMSDLVALAKENKLKIIEDCAQAHGAEFEGKRVGAIGDVGAFSFYPGKNLGAYGDAGAIVTNNKELARKARMIANHGRVSKYNHEFEGRNSRLDGLQAAVLSVKLRYLEKWTAKRVDVAEKYMAGLSQIPGLILPVRSSWAFQVYHLFVIRVERRDELQEFLNNEGIMVGVHYPISLPMLGAYKYLGQADEPLFCNRCGDRLLSLPIGEHLTAEDVTRVIKKVREFYCN